MDERPRARAPARGPDQGRDGWHQHAVHRLPRHPLRRLQAVRLRPRARRRDARALPRDEERDRLDEPEADQPVRAVAATRVLDRLEELYGIGGGPGANRPGLSAAEQEACELAASWMESAGLEVSWDPAGN